MWQNGVISIYQLISFEADLWFQTSCFSPPARPYRGQPPEVLHRGGGRTHTTHMLERFQRQSWLRGNNRPSLSVFILAFSLLVLGSCLDRAKRPEHVTKQSAGFGRWDWHGLESWLSWLFLVRVHQIFVCLSWFDFGGFENALIGVIDTLFAPSLPPVMCSWVINNALLTVDGVETKICLIQCPAETICYPL